MHKEEIVKEDGRYLIYYTFPTEDAGEAGNSTPSAAEAADV